MGAAFARASAHGCFPPAQGSSSPPRRRSAPLQHALELISLKAKKKKLHPNLISVWFKVCGCVLGLCWRRSGGPCWDVPMERAPRSRCEPPGPLRWPNRAEVGSSSWAGHSPPRWAPWWWQAGREPQRRGRGTSGAAAALGRGSSSLQGTGGGSGEATASAQAGVVWGEQRCHPTRKRYPGCLTRGSARTGLRGLRCVRGEQRRGLLGTCVEMGTSGFSGGFVA